MTNSPKFYSFERGDGELMGLLCAECETKVANKNDIVELIWPDPAKMCDGCGREVREIKRIWRKNHVDTAA